MRTMSNRYLAHACAAAIAILGVSLPHRSLANTAFADATTIDPNNPTPCKACHYPGRESEGRQGLNQVGQQFFFNCRINSDHDCHTLPQRAALPNPPAPAPQPNRAASMPTAQFTDACKSGDSYFAVLPAGGGHLILFQLKKFHKVHLQLPAGSTYAHSCGDWPGAGDATRPVKFE